MTRNRKIANLVKETAGFSYEFIRHPKGVGSIIPSSRALARAMRRTAQDYGHPESIVIEAGAGTGAITRELVAHFPRERLIINELNPRLARRLRDRFKGSTIRRGGVEQLDIWTHPQPKTIVSSLPFRSLPPDIAHGIEAIFFAALREDPANVLVQFTYGQRSPLHLPEAADICAEKVNYAWLNFPPAHVWVYRRKAQAS
ncbi:phospholipid methyltransferase [uncultured Cardiobacterium sp.]|uniref:class I SAM-dependent methyltransferase n=1 Tax=uncultured Cardiobacterium sp. TaxID=417619 RepID=UPI00262EE98B|nr:phospholipid methyltransferase [uncultured Cardiobacterium sp.]